MNLLYLNSVIAECPALDKPMSLTDEIGLIRITIDPECIPNDAHHELLAMLAGDYNLPPLREMGGRRGVCCLLHGRRGG